MRYNTVPDKAVADTQENLFHEEVNLKVECLNVCFVNHIVY